MTNGQNVLMLLAPVEHVLVNYATNYLLTQRLTEESCWRSAIRPSTASNGRRVERSLTPPVRSRPAYAVFASLNSSGPRRA